MLPFTHYINISLAILSTMCFSAISSIMTLICVSWLIISVVVAKKKGILEDNDRITQRKTIH